MLGFIAFLFTFAGASLLYLGSSHQKWRKTPIASLVSVPAGALLLVCGLGGWMYTVQALTGFFIFLTLLMLLWSIFPFIGCCLRGSR